MLLYRASGNPIDPTHKKAQEEALHGAMDALEAKLGKCNQENASIFEKALGSVHEELLVKYPIAVNILYPKRKRDMQELCKKFGAIAMCIEDGKLVAYILDRV